MESLPGLSLFYADDANIDIKKYLGSNAANAANAGPKTVYVSFADDVCALTQDTHNVFIIPLPTASAFSSFSSSAFPSSSSAFPSSSSAFSSSSASFSSSSPEKIRGSLAREIFSDNTITKILSKPVASIRQLLSLDNVTSCQHVGDILTRKTGNKFLVAKMKQELLDLSIIDDPCERCIKNLLILIIKMIG